ncbi:MAG: hypothetical protein QOI80_284, partial [Solirubrobacteraceae bacterium]|nr:hypothetical protein [Solirubrobacteraceae bacterium]
LLDAIMGDFAERHGKARWSEKSPGQPIELAADLFPQAQFVHIVRDPRDVVASSLRTPWAAVPDAGAIARSWRDYTLRTVRRGFALGPARFLQIRYEDLTRDPAAVLELVCAFLGEPYAPAMVDDPSLRAGTVTSVGAPWQQRALAGIVPAQEGRWREQLGRRQKASVHAVVAPVLAPLGYDATAGRLLALSARLVRAGEPLRRLRTRRQAPPPSSPEELYRRTRAFTDAQAARIA